MDKKINIVQPAEKDLNVPESPKPLAFTIEFGAGKTIDQQRHKALVEKFQNRHKRGQSLSKLDDLPITSTSKRHPSTGNLPRKSSFQAEGGYFSSDEKTEKPKNVRSAASTLKLKSNFTLPLKNIISDKMTQSFPNGCFNLDTIRSPDDSQPSDVLSPDLTLDSPFSPKKHTPSPVVNNKMFLRQFSSPSVESEKSEEHILEVESDLDKSDDVSDAGTYTVETDNYTEEQKARMSIDREFNIEKVSLMKKTEEYVQSLSKKERTTKTVITKTNSAGQSRTKETSNTKNQKQSNLLPKSPNIPQSFLPSKQKNVQEHRSKLLSPILSPTQNFSIVDVTTPIEIPEDKKSENRILYPSPKAKTGINLQQSVDQGCFTSVTSSGAFSKKNEGQKRGHTRQPSLTKSEVQILTYVDVACDEKTTEETKPHEPNSTVEKVINLPPAIGGISGLNSPTKIPSPVHTSLTRPRSRNSVSSLNIDLSDSSLETESFLKPTQNYINTLQKRLSLDSDPDSDYDSKYNNLRLNNESQKSLHIRHNSFDDKNLKISNKLEHFQNKNLQGIDQTYTNKFNQYPHTKVVHKIQNSPNNSPIRRSSSFSNKNYINVESKVSNLTTSRIPKDNNLRNSPSLSRNGSVQRSASTANIKPSAAPLRRSSINSEHSKIDRSQFADTESSSEDDFEKNLLKKKDFTNLTNTRYNRAFSLRRARLDCEQPPPPKCPNTPEMRRKFQPTDHNRSERAISVDRRPVKNEVPSRYLQIAKTKNAPEKIEVTKNVPKPNSSIAKSVSGKPQVFSRTDSGRFSVRTTKPLNQNTQKGTRKDGTSKKQSGGRSNSSLSSREVEFQNWKRRKSYDPMKAAAEGKKKAEMVKKQNLMSQSYLNQNQDCDSSPSHSSSVHRSQSFHGTAALEQMISSEEDDDLTLSADEGFSPPTPSPCELSPARRSWRNRLLQ